MQTADMPTRLQAIAHALIKAEIESDPYGRGYAGKTPQEQADLINAPFIFEASPAVTRHGQPVSWGAIHHVIHTFGEWPNVQLRAEERPADLAVRAAMSVLKADPMRMIDPTDPRAWERVKSWLIALRTADDLTEACLDAIYDLPNVPVAAVTQERHPRVVDIFLGFPLPPLPAAPSPTGDLVADAAARQDLIDAYHEENPGPPNALAADDIAAAMAA
jgi:hypothetical protein